MEEGPLRSAWAIELRLTSISSQSVHSTAHRSKRRFRVGEPQWTDDGIVQVASLEDLLATKVKVLLQRIEVKDYLDVAALLGSGVPLASGLADARSLFGPAFQPSESLKSLVYFEGGDLKSLTETTRHLLIHAATAVRDLPSVPVVDKQLTVG
jgi:hypothetical protein